MTVKQLLIGLSIFSLLLGFFLFSISLPPSSSQVSVSKKNNSSNLNNASTQPSTPPPSPKKLNRQTPLNAEITKLPPPRILANWTGYRTFSLGKHTIAIRGGEWQVHLEVVLGTQDPEAYRMFAPLRRKLLRMLYFLANHRVIEGFRQIGGQERFRVDFENRVKNVIRNRSFTVDFPFFEIQRIQFEDEETDLIDNEQTEKDAVQRAKDAQPHSEVDPEEDVYQHHSPFKDQSF